MRVTAATAFTLLLTSFVALAADEPANQPRPSLSARSVEEVRDWFVSVPLSTSTGPWAVMHGLLVQGENLALRTPTGEMISAIDWVLYEGSGFVEADGWGFRFRFGSARRTAQQHPAQFVSYGLRGGLASEAAISSPTAVAALQTLWQRERREYCRGADPA